MRGDPQGALRKQTAFYVGAAEKSSVVSLPASAERLTLDVFAAIEEYETGRVVSDSELEWLEWSNPYLFKYTRLQQDLHQFGDGLDRVNAERGRKAAPLVEMVLTAPLAEMMMGPVVQEALTVGARVLARVEVTLARWGAGAVGKVAPRLERLAEQARAWARTTRPYYQPRPEAARKVCFPAGTPVSLRDGLKPIQSVRPGEQVWAYDLAARAWVLRRVVERHEHDYEGHLVSIALAGEVIEATSNHPFWVVEGDGVERRPLPEHTAARPPEARTPGRWVDAGDLRVDDVFLLRSGRRGRVTGLALRQARMKVYNLEVDGLHTYSVGEAEVLVHNRMLNSQRRPGNLKLRGDASPRIPEKFRNEYDSIPREHWDRSKKGRTIKERYHDELAKKGENARSPKDFVDTHHRLWDNSDQIAQFETPAKKAMREVTTGQPAKTGPGSQQTKTGRSRPDLYDGKTYEVDLENGGTLRLKGATEIKGWRYIKDKKARAKYQLRDIATAAHQNGDPFNLVISPETEQIAENVVDMVRGPGGNMRGKIVQFDPKTHKFTEIDYSDVKRGMPWKR